MLFDLRLVWWYFLLIGGFLYVWGVLCHRPFPFFTNSAKCGDFVAMLLVAPVFYVFGVRHTLLPFSEKLPKAILWNVLGFAVPFFLALHWQYLGKALKLGFLLTWTQLVTLTLEGKIALALAVILIASLMARQFQLAAREGILWAYFAGFVCPILVVALISWRYSKRYYLHVHHYCWAAFFIPFFGFRNPVSLISQAIFAGICVEGIGRWGMDPMWVAR